MKARLDTLVAEVLERIRIADSAAALEHIEQTDLARKGELLGLMRGIKNLPADERAPFGQAVNQAKASLEVAVGERKAEFVSAKVEAATSDEHFDPTEPAGPLPGGHLHPSPR